jgi:hypothetical protein
MEKFEDARKPSWILAALLYPYMHARQYYVDVLNRLDFSSCHVQWLHFAAVFQKTGACGNFPTVWNLSIGLGCLLMLLELDNCIACMESYNACRNGWRAQEVGSYPAAHVLHSIIHAVVNSS